MVSSLFTFFSLVCTLLEIPLIHLLLKSPPCSAPSFISFFAAHALHCGLCGLCCILCTRLQHFSLLPASSATLMVQACPLCVISLKVRVLHSFPSRRSLVLIPIVARWQPYQRTMPAAGPPPPAGNRSEQLEPGQLHWGRNAPALAPGGCDRLCTPACSYCQPTSAAQRLGLRRPHGHTPQSMPDNNTDHVVHGLLQAPKHCRVRTQDIPGPKEGGA